MTTLGRHAGKTDDPPTGTRVTDEAARWLVRGTRGLAPAEQAALAEWLAADPDHRREYERLQGIWSHFDEASRGDVHRLSARLPARPNPWFAWLRPLVAAAAVGMVTMVGYWGLKQWYAQPTFSHYYVTARGEQQTVELPDGSLLQLDTDTRVEVTFRRRQREVVLERGRSMFEVAPAPERPLEVLAAGVKVRVVGTSFSVARSIRPGTTPDRVDVEVAEGHVQVAVSGEDGVGQVVDLRAGQGAYADRGGRFSAIRRIAPDQIAPWRDGWVFFDNVPLAEALAEFERYGDTGLVIDDPEVAGLRITGSFELNRTDGFAKVLPEVMPVALKPAQGKRKIVRR